IACDHEEMKLAKVKSDYGVRISKQPNEAVEKAQVVIFAVKPQSFAQSARELSAIIQENKPLIISIAAGVRSDSIQSWLGGNVGIVRAMPNTPALIGCGASALYANT